MAHGELIDGVWHTRFHNTKATGGRFQRGQPKYRNWVTADGSAGPSGSGGFPAARGRYHLYVSLACPWAHRTVLFRKLKGLEDVISMSEVEPVMGDEGWQFGPDADDDSVNHKKHLHEIYTMADPRYTGRSSVPILWDKEQRTIVNNELPEIIRMLNSAFDAFTNNRTDYYPAALRGEIDAVNELVFKNVNNGVYRCGFASTQEAYEEAFLDLFGTLDQLEERLSAPALSLRRADHRGRLAAVHHAAALRCGLCRAFKCNLRRIADYPHLSNYLRDLYQVPGVAGTVNIDHIKRHYYMSMLHINPTGIVPLGPALDFEAEHDRGRFG